MINRLIGKCHYVLQVKREKTYNGFVQGRCVNGQKRELEWGNWSVNYRICPLVMNKDGYKFPCIGIDIAPRDNKSQRYLSNNLGIGAWSCLHARKAQRRWICYEAIMIWLDFKLLNTDHPWLSSFFFKSTSNRPWETNLQTWILVHRDTN